MAEHFDNTTVPPMMAEMEWVWVLTSPATKVQDSIFVLEMEEKDGRNRRIVPVFEQRDDAAKLKFKLCQQKPGNYAEQTMRLSEVGKFAAKNNLEIMLLDENGTIMAHLEAKMEQVPVH